METVCLTRGGFASNCYIVHASGEAFVVDPSAEAEQILSALRERSLALRGILLTHGHFDHLLSLGDLLAECGDVPVYAHSLDLELFSDPQKNASAPLLYRPMLFPTPTHALSEGDVLTLGGEKLTVLHTPGHTRGSVCFDTGDILFTGDTLFSEGYGRCDLYGGDMRALHSSLSRLRELSQISDRRILCGHGEDSTLRRALSLLLYF